jgi:uncharacterized protein YjiS (DUF1127 family)
MSTRLTSKKYWHSKKTNKPCVFRIAAMQQLSLLATQSQITLFCVNIRRCNVITQLRNAIKRHATIRRTTAELSRLSDRELGDLGIARCDINRVARSAL